MASVRMASPRSPRRRMDATSVKRRRAREEKVPRAGGKCARGRRRSGKGVRRGKGAEKGGVVRQEGKGLTRGAHLESAPSESGREREEGGRTWNPAPLPPACLIRDCESCLPPATVLGTSHLRPRILPPACDRARIFSAASSPLLDSWSLVEQARAQHQFKSPHLSWSQTTYSHQLL